MLAGSRRWLQLDAPVWLAMVALLAGGWWLKGTAEAATIVYAEPRGPLRIQYPDGWLAVPGSASLLDVQDPFSAGSVPTRLIVTRHPREAGKTLDQIAKDRILARSRVLALYRVLAIQTRQVGGREAVAVEYAFIEEPQAAVLEAQQIPAVTRGVEVSVSTEGAVYSIDFRAAGDRFDRERRRFEELLGTVRL